MLARPLWHFVVLVPFAVAYTAGAFARKSGKQGIAIGQLRKITGRAGPPQLMSALSGR